MPAAFQRRRPKLVLDQQGGALVDPQGNFVGPPPDGGLLEVRVPFNNRYRPGHQPGDQAVYGRDFWRELPWGITIANVALQIFFHYAQPELAGGDWNIVGAPANAGRTVYATLNGGVRGFDYELRWSVTDSEGGVWTRSALLLCGFVW